MESQVISQIIHKKNELDVSDKELIKIINETLLNFGHMCLVDYGKAYERNPREFINCFIKYDSVKMACQYAIKYAIKSGILDEIEQKDFSEWVNKQSLEERWKPVLNKFILILWGCIN